MLLTATAAGLATAYSNQPIEVEGLRDRLRQTLQTSGHPQILLRIGRAPAVQPAVRRPVEEVLLDGAEPSSGTGGVRQACP